MIVEFDSSKKERTVKAADFQKTKSARVIQVIETVSLAGDGTNAHPIYEIHQYWSLDGKLLAKSEPGHESTRR